MKPSERVKEIENKWCDSIGKIDTSEVNWLINRVKRLTEALEDITSHCGLGSDTPGEVIALAFNLRAHKALEEEE